MANDYIWFAGGIGVEVGALRRRFVGRIDGFGRRVAAASSAGTRNSLYDDSGHLIEESSLSGSSAAYDYIWFDGKPIAQENIGSTTQWNELNHLGAPFMQTNSSGAVSWQADYAPYGAIYDLRTADAHQPLRLPGQEAEEFTTGNANGATTRYYNGARWYYPAWGMYTQPDPLAVQNLPYDPYLYADQNPYNFIDPDGRQVYRGATPALWPVVGGQIGSSTHSFIEVVPPSGSPRIYSYGPRWWPLGPFLQPMDYIQDNIMNTQLTSLQVIPPPPGFSQAQWDSAFCTSGNNLNNELTNTPIPYNALFSNSNGAITTLQVGAGVPYLQAVALCFSLV